MNRLANANLIGGIVVTAVGMLFFAGAFQYNIGTPSAMGAGFFPLAVSVLVILLGLLVIGGSFRTILPTLAIEWRPLAAVLAGIVAFIITQSLFGFVPASFAAAAVSAYGDRRARPLSVVVVGLAVALLAWLIFTVALGLPLRPFKGF